jgi:serine/threonine protein kinase
MMQTPLQKIRELRALLDEGLLSEEEFSVRKNAILDRDLAPEDRNKTSLATTNINQGTDLGFSVGQEVGPQSRPYRLERLLGQGGMGQVWQATDLATQAELGHSEIVALKILPPELTQSALHARLLVEETSLVRKLAHENIVRVYEWAQDPASGSYFIIMEYLDGQDLDSYLAQRGPCTLAQILGALTPVAHALNYAWDRHSLVHRDLKPSNLFLTQQGDIKLLDFGISARLRSNTKGVSASTSGFKKSSPRFPNAGTVGYRAPEAGVHQHIFSPTLDVYAVAIMIYQMLEGNLPFSDARLYVGHHIKTASPVCPSGLSATQWEVLQSGFALDPNQRPPTVLALVDALQGQSLPIEQPKQAKQTKQAIELKQTTVHERTPQQNAQLQMAVAAHMRSEQRRQRKVVEEQRRQQASLALHALIEKQKKLHATEVLAERERLARINEGKLMRVKSLKLDQVVPKRDTGDGAHAVPISWEEAQRYLAMMSRETDPGVQLRNAAEWHAVRREQ